jgi:putative lipoprotein
VIAAWPPSARAQAASDDDWLGPDKALHFGACAVIAGSGYGVTALFTDDYALRLAVGGGVAILAGAGKELLDLTGLGTPSWRDFTWDVIGTATGLLVAFLVDLAIRELGGGPERATEPERPAR